MVGLFLEIVPMFVAKGFARRRFVAQINADMIPARTHILARCQSHVLAFSGNGYARAGRG